MQSAQRSVRAAGRWIRHTSAATLACSAAACASAGVAPSPLIIAGSNYNIDFNQEVEVPFSGFAGAWFLDTRLAHAPDAGPMIKSFASPITDTLDPILLDALQPFALPVRETFEIVEPPVLALNTPTGAPINPFDSVYGWREEILTDGWEWVTPDDPRYSEAPLFGKPLITRNGNPHPSRPAFFPIGSLEPDVNRPIILDPAVVDVEFARIDAGETLGVNKALLWVGTEGNRIWGDQQLDDGTRFNERAIRVIEHPTNFAEVYEIDGNFNGDFRVDQHDLDLVMMNWGRDADAEGLPRGWFSDPADGVIGQEELDKVLLNWGDTIFPVLPADSVPVPEPGTAAGAAVLLALIAKRHGRNRD